MKTVREGSQVRFLCLVTGDPQPSVRWTHEERDPKDATITILQDSLCCLEIDSAKPEHAGLYRLELSNPSGSVSAETHLQVTGEETRDITMAPKVLEPLRDVTVQDGQPFSLACEVLAHPPPSVVWTRDGRPLPPSSDDFQVVLDGTGTVVLLVREAFPEDNACFACRVRNSSGEVVTSCMVTVQGSSPSAGTPQMLIDDLSGNKEEELDSSHLLPAPVDSDIPVTHENSSSAAMDDQSGIHLPIPASETAGVAASSQNAQIVSPLSSVPVETSTGVCHQSEDSSPHHRRRNTDGAPLPGRHLPRLNLEVNSRKRPPVDLLPPEKYEVQSPSPSSDCELIPAQILTGPKSVVTQVGADVRLSITYAGQPVPKVTWIKAGKLLLEGNSVAVFCDNGYSELCIRNASCDDSGKYLVVVENRAGCDCDFASLKVEGPPDPPVMEPRAVLKSPTSVEVSWSGSPFDGGCQIQRYLVDMSEASSEDRNWTRVSTELSTSCVVSGLTPGVSYVFVVRAENVRGIGEPCAESTVVTLPALSCGDGDTEESDPDEPVVPAAGPVVVQQGARFQDFYELHEEVGKGRFGVVYRCTRKTDGTPAAAKVVPCIRIVHRDKVLEEIAIMNLLRGHPKLLNLEAAFEKPREKPREMILVTEFISGGELFERVIADDFVLTERDCVLFMRQICSGVAYMHEKRVVHLDLKPENILCQSKMNHKIKLIDFGLAQRYDPDGDLKVLFGTPEFIAPEVVNYECISFATDMWSVGVICYVLLSGLSPFMGDTDSETYSNIIRVDYDFEDEVFERISDTAKDFIRQLLIKNPTNRPSAQQCLEHEWLKKVPRRSTRPVALPTEKLKKFVIRRKWLKTGNAILALSRMVNLTGISPALTKQGGPQPLNQAGPNGTLNCQQKPLRDPADSSEAPEP